MSKLKEAKFEKKESVFPFIMRLLKYSMRYKKNLYMFIIFVALVAGIEALYPVVWMNFLDTVIVPGIESRQTGSPFDNTGLLKFFGIYMLLALALSTFVHIFIKNCGKIQENVMFDVRQDIFRKFQELSFSYYDKSALGWLMTRITSDTIKITELISWNFIEMVWGTFMIIFCLTAMFIYNWKLALIVAVTIPVLVIVSTKIRELILKYSRESRRENSIITAAYNEHINGVEVNKSLVQEERAGREFEVLTERMKVASYKSAYYNAMFLPLVIFIGSIAAALIIYYGGFMVLTPESGVTVGILAAFFGYATLIYEPITDLSRFYSQAQACMSAGERIFTLLDTQPEILDKKDAKEFSRIKGDIEFDSVTFYYEKDKPVLENINLKIKAGQSVALVGETGGGKSTFINLICRFYEPKGGAIKIDGIDYMDMTVESLRSQLGVVLQTPHLFSGTIRENVKYGRDEATEAEVINALTLAGGEEFIEQLDDEVGEAGENLSLGQKQLISFARAILANPRIFIMDEATSSVDTLTEAKIQSGIHGIMEGRTSLIIAHRLSTIKNCDRILVIKKGKIVEDGTHKELMKKKGYYYQLYTKQLRDEKEKEFEMMEQQ
ncbi:MAG: ABC transporter ATP-binding protein [Bacteroidetes bacterium]|nr:ABC transporter ATP-binding protein [Bacteroidota bacterium]